MKVKVINEFVDKHTGVLHKYGSTFECAESRLVEIKQAGLYVVPVIEEKEKSPKERK